MSLNIKKNKYFKEPQIVLISYIVRLDNEFSDDTIYCVIQHIVLLNKFLLQLFCYKYRF